MKSFTRAFAALAVAVALSMPTIALAAVQQRERGREKSPVVRLVEKIKKFIDSLDDLPIPPIPKP